MMSRRTTVCAILLIIYTSLISSVAMAQETTHFTCPPLKSIQNTPGEYSWRTTITGWEGYFSAPKSGKGYSNAVTKFIGARWIQFSNLDNSPGYVQCDYAGNRNDEIIRFAQKQDKATKRPENDYWTHVDKLKFPSVQRECSVQVELCSFEQL